MKMLPLLVKESEQDMTGTSIEDTVLDMLMGGDADHLIPIE